MSGEAHFDLSGAFLLEIGKSKIDPSTTLTSPSKSECLVCIWACGFFTKIIMKALLLEKKNKKNYKDK